MASRQHNTYAETPTLSCNAAEEAHDFRRVALVDRVLASHELIAKVKKVDGDRASSKSGARDVLVKNRSSVHHGILEADQCTVYVDIGEDVGSRSLLGSRFVIIPGRQAATSTVTST